MTGLPQLLALALSMALFVGLKGVLAHWPTNRDARDISAQLTRIVDLDQIDEIVFVGMRPFYGLNVYLDKKIEGIEIDERRFHYSEFVASENVCDELNEHEQNVWVVKSVREQKFVAAALECGADSTRIGTIRGDGNDIAVYVVHPRHAG